MSEVQAEAAPAAPDPVVIVEQPKPTIEDTMAAVWDKNNPDTRVSRSDTGQFKSKEAPVEAASNIAESDNKVSDQTPTETATETAPPSIPRPQSWSAELDDMWAKLSPEHQDFIAKRESDAHKKITALGEEAKAAAQFKSVIEKYAPVINGNDPGREIETLLATKASLLRDPVGSIQWLAQQLNVDLARFAQPQLDGSTPESAHINALTRELAAVKQQLAEHTNRMSAREQAEMQAREQSVEASIEKYSQGKDYWDDIEGEIVNQIYALKANPENKLADPMTLLKEAEERAIRLTPKVQEKLDKARREKEEATKQAEAKRKADEAKKLASLNVKSSTGTSPKSTGKDMWSEMADIYDKMQATG